MVNEYDVLIVGGGPAGLLAAKTAALSGLKVCLLETHKDYNQVLRACSAQFILDDGYEGEYMKAKPGKLQFMRSGLEVDYHGELLEVTNKFYYSPSGNYIWFSNRDQSAFAIKFNKQKLLKGLARECEELGVHMSMKTTVLSGIDMGSQVELTVNRDGTLEKAYGKKLIIAEGVNARLTKYFGILQGRRLFANAAVSKFFVKDIEGVVPNSWNLYYGTAYHCYSPVIIGPSLIDEKTFEVTISCNQKNAADEIYEQFTTNSPVKNMFRHAKVLSRSGCFIKAAESIKTPYKGNVLAIGDSAAFVEVEVQGAFLCGHYAGNAVKEELEGKEGFKKYTQWWKNAFEFNSDEYLRVSQGYALVPVYTDDELNYLFSFFDGVRLEGTYSQYKTPKLIWDEINKHSEQIKTERKSLYDKIQRNGQLTLTNSFEKK